MRKEKGTMKGFSSHFSPYTTDHSHHNSRYMRKIIINLLLLCIIGRASAFAQQDRQSAWHGFVKHSFVFDGRQARIVTPQQALPGNPWVWRAYFPDWHTDMDSILLSRGFHIAYVDCGDMFGSAEAMQVWERFYDYLIREKHFAEKPALEGVSRGGLYIYAWAKRNPGKVSCIYAEAPVLDIKSWPGGKGKGRGSDADWKKLFKAYNYTEEQAMAFSDNPVDHLETLAAFKVPVVHVVCERDSIVPLAENTAILEKNYKKYGGNIRVDYMTEGVNDVGHHFTIANPGQYADFIFNHTIPLKETLSNEKFVHGYGSLNNTFYQVKEKKELTVAFLGGSITQNPGWKDKTVKYLQEVYPQTRFHFIYAGIASLGSVPHAFRLQTDVLSKGKVDLLFVEAAVNDLANKTPATQQQKAMEGIIRHALTVNPYMNIVLMAFVDEDKIYDYENGKVPAEVALHGQMAKYYQLAFLNLAQEVQQRIANKEFTWAADFKDLHPSPFGQEIYFQAIKTLLKKSGAAYKNERLVPEKLPVAQYKAAYDNGRYVSVDKATGLKRFSLNANWQPVDKAGTRQGFVHVPVLESGEAGASFGFAFTGTAAGIAIVTGPDAGMIKYAVDGKPAKTIDLYTQWSGGLHLPWYLVLADGLSKGEHVLKVEIIAQKNKKSKGNACRIVHFLVNE